MPPAARSDRSEPLTLYTIGHSTHPIETFLALLAEHRIETLADVRSFPSSRRWPQFNQASLEASLKDARIEYRWLKALGGRRQSKRTDSPHVAWTEPAFRAYADYMDTDDFVRGLSELLDAAAHSRVAYMCAEGLWWRCHRRIISDRLVSLGHRVMHIMPDGRLSEHALPDFAQIVGDGRIIYGGPNSSL
jgi:uncharacterized protein (DUF488 family)